MSGEQWVGWSHETPRVGLSKILWSIARYTLDAQPYRIRASFVIKTRRASTALSTSLAMPDRPSPFTLVWLFFSHRLQALARAMAFLWHGFRLFAAPAPEERGPDAAEELDKLRATVRRRLVMSAVDGGHKFLPAGDLDKAATRRAIRSILPRHTPSELIDFVHRDAKRIFLALVLDSGAKVQHIESVMRACHESNMKDDRLPVDEMGCMGGGETCRSRHETPLDLFHDPLWTGVFFDFNVNQVRLTAPVFISTKFQYELHERCLLPFVWRSPEERQGHFSTVWEAKIHPDHCQDESGQVRALFSGSKPRCTDPC